MTTTSSHSATVTLPADEEILITREFLHQSTWSTGRTPSPTSSGAGGMRAAAR